jgi:endothelin-converting enzyme
MVGRLSFLYTELDRGTNIVNTFHDVLPQISCMDRSSAVGAQKKADAIIARVGYPLNPDSTDPESLRQCYAATEIKREDFLVNVLRSTKADVPRRWALSFWVSGETVRHGM